MSMATSGVLFRNALTVTVGSASRSCVDTAPLGRPSRRGTSSVSTPVCRSPAATTNSTATVMTPEFENPASAWSAGNRSVTKIAASAATISTWAGWRPQTSNPNTAATMAMAPQAASVMACSVGKVRGRALVDRVGELQLFLLALDVQHHFLLVAEEREELQCLVGRGDRL